MKDQREVQFDRAIEFATSHNIHKVFETSALDGSMVEEVFSCAGKELFQQTERENQEAKQDQELDMNGVSTKGPKKPVGT